MASRCAAIPTLTGIINSQVSHEWDGVPHVTSLITGAMEYWLKVNRGYAVEPESHMWMMLGQGFHSLMKDQADLLGNPAEMSLKLLNKEGLKIAQGTIDYLELFWDEEADTLSYDLYDYKTWGSYSVSKAMGVQPDLRSEELQLNAYRVMCEQLGLVIRYMRVQAVVRNLDHRRGVSKKLYVFPVDRMDNDMVLSYFSIKSQIITLAIEDGKMPAVCTTEERWEGRKCKQYCEVAEHCPMGKKVRLGLA